jgi:hypothetical protein
LKGLCGFYSRHTFHVEPLVGLDGAVFLDVVASFSLPGVNNE